MPHQPRTIADDWMAIHMARKRRRARIRREIELANQQALDAGAESSELLDRIDSVLKGDWSAIRRSLRVR
jgi:hypothetical protein